jgi:hypothetical protein
VEEEREREWMKRCDDACEDGKGTGKKGRENESERKTRGAWDDTWKVEKREKDWENRITEKERERERELKKRKREETKEKENIEPSGKVEKKRRWTYSSWSVARTSWKTHW